MKKILIGVCLTLIVVFVLYNVPGYKSSARHTFTLPQFQLACFEVELQDGAIFSDWDIYQPTRFNIKGSNVIISNITLHAACETVL